MDRFCMWCAVVCLTACGAEGTGTQETGEPEARAENPAALPTAPTEGVRVEAVSRDFSALAGQWGPGISLAIISTTGTPRYAVHLNVAVQGDSVELTGLCPDGSGTALLKGFGGEGNAAYGAVRLVCPPEDQNGCAVTTEIESVRVYLDNVGKLGVSALTTLTDCAGLSLKTETRYFFEPRAKH